MINTDGILLKNAPLKEVIFELHWELDFIPQQKVYVDDGFEEAAMNFRNECQEDFKYFQLLAPSSVIPFTLLNNKVTHRYFREKDKHPMYQLGPGVFTVNDNNKNYSWGDFRKLILFGVDCLKRSYTKELVPSKLELRYIDAVGCTVFGDENKFDFLRKNLNVNAESYPFVNGELADINFSKRFIIDKDSYLNITVATGKDTNSNEDLIIWHTAVINKERISWAGLEGWIENAHLVCSETFKNMLSKKLYEYFSR
jgi:uncharacterized protein (TIGR04255 family)